MNDTTNPMSDRRAASAARPSLALMIAATLLAACATPEPPAPTPAPTLPAPPPPAAVPPPPPPPPPPRPAAPKTVTSPAEARLAEGVALYDAGDYNGALRKLQGATEIWASDSGAPVKVSAHKIMAFSYCVTGRRTPCRRQFDALLKLDRGYTLTPAEAGHPAWGPVFMQAKRAADAAAKRSTKRR